MLTDTTIRNAKPRDKFYKVSDSSGRSDASGRCQWWCTADMAIKVIGTPLAAGDFLYSPFGGPSGFGIW